MKQDSLASLPTKTLHWAYQYIGTPWVNGAQGPDAFDCWSFFRHVQREQFGIEVPEYAIDANDFKKTATEFANSTERAAWLPAIVPSLGCAVLMAHCKFPSHVGVWLDADGGGVLHCVRGEGVVFSTLAHLKNSGWGRVEYYQHASHA